MRLIITHCEVDMVEIKEAFYHKYGRTLKSFIKVGTLNLAAFRKSIDIVFEFQGYALGHYLYALYALIGEDVF